MAEADLGPAASPGSAWAPLHERVTKRDQGRLDRIRELTDPAHPVAVTHWLAVTRRKPDAPSRPVPSASASPPSTSTGTTAPPEP
jgi:hypothetical protein